MNTDLEDLLQSLERGRILPVADAARAMIDIAEGRTPVPELVRFLQAYNRRSPVAHEIAAFVEVLRTRMIRVNAPADNTLCNCGTGGDGRGSINVSTTAAFIIAAAGVPVAKHGNRSVSSRCGSTDCLAALGVRPSKAPEEAEALLAEHGLCFLNAPDFHPALRHAVEARRTLASRGERSLFNLLGPLLNPASVKRQCLGVYDPVLLETLARVLVQFGVTKGFVIHGDGYDEVSLTGATRLAWINNGESATRTFVPEELRLRRAEPESLRGGDAAMNARIADEVLSGTKTGPVADVVLLNAAAGIVAGWPDGLELADAFDLAREMVASGKAKAKLDVLRKAAPADA